jgi:autotransporter passenger strand-loop-strand repeat protein
LSGGGQYNAGAIDGTTTSGGFDEVLSGATASGTLVEAGGIEAAFSGGTTTGTMASGGGQYDFGVASGTVLDSGGYQLGEAGATATGTTSSSGGAQYVFGAASGEVVSGGSTGSDAVTFSGGGELKLDASASFGGTVAGFQAWDFLDLADVAFGPITSVSFTEATSNQSGTLTVTDGVNTASITLLGQYMASQFTSASDGHGGTVIGDPSVAAANNSASLVAPHQA